MLSSAEDEATSKIEVSTETPPPSLVNPNFDGLWSVAWIGRENGLLYRFYGFCCCFLFLGSWLFGMFSPFWLSILWFYDFKIAFTILTIVCLYPFVVTVEGWPAAVRHLLLPAAYWFDGGCSISFEMPPEGYEHECSADPEKQTSTILTIHPHGMFNLGVVFNTCLRVSAYTDHNHTSQEKAKACGRRQVDQRDVFGPPETYKGLVAPVMMVTPLFRHVVVSWAQCAMPADRATTKRCMQQGQSFGLLPGGFYEATFMQRGREQIYIRHVKGFVKYALQHGYRIVPAYTFGECQTYYNLLPYLGFGKWRKWFNHHKIATIWPVGKWFCPIMPLNTGVGLHTITSYGKRLPRIENPSQAEIDDWHQWYIDEIKMLYERNKHRFGIEADLEVW